ncbi:MAG: hypothetical protein WBA57_07095 [Elainellaceae cyanobacterium]
MKIVLLGNAGAGKSTMAKHLIGDRNIACLSLDAIAWNEDVKRKSIAESIGLLHEFLSRNQQWVIEGCYGDLVEAVLPHCEELRFLNPGIDVCVSHCLQRPWEPEKFTSPEAQQAMLIHLIDWVKEYESRRDEFRLQRHREVFNAFKGKKLEYHHIEDYTA